MLGEAAIRSALLDRVASRWATSDRTLVVEEFGTHFGGSRADVAVVNGHLWAYEIKSDADRLDRLGLQAAAYCEVFDYVALVLTRRHLDRAVAMVPSWWEVIVATDTASSTRLTRVRRGRRNGSIRPVAVACLLWRDELLRALEALGADRGIRSATRERLAERLVAAAPAHRLGEIVRNQIRARPAWRADPARMPDGGTLQLSRTSSGFLARRVRLRR